MGILNKDAPLKFMVVRANNNPFMTKDLRKAIMESSKLKNEFNKIRSYNSERAYKKQRNLCTYLLRKEMKNYYSNLDPSCISDNKRFWNMVKPLFTDKVRTMEQIALIENDEIIYNAKDVSEVFNTFFSNAIKVLNIEPNNAIINDIITESDLILIAIERYKFHPSILKINEKFCKIRRFVFF